MGFMRPKAFDCRQLPAHHSSRKKHPSPTLPLLRKGRRQKPLATGDQAPLDNRTPAKSHLTLAQHPARIKACTPPRLHPRTIPVSRPVLRSAQASPVESNLAQT